MKIVSCCAEERNCCLLGLYPCLIRLYSSVPTRHPSPTVNSPPREAPIEAGMWGGEGMESGIMRCALTKSRDVGNARACVRQFAVIYISRQTSVSSTHGNRTETANEAQGVIRNERTNAHLDACCSQLAY